MRRLTIAVLAAAGAVLASVLAVPATADAATLAPTSGYDVSWPQCSGDSATVSLPTSPAFAVIGVNGGLANNTNPCFAAELEWAQSRTTGASVQPVIQYYVNIANPGHVAASWWPKSNVTKSGAAVPSNPYGTCSNASGMDPDSTACSYVYGYSMAYDDVRNRGLAGMDVTGARWWLDVESASESSWNGTQSTNRAVLEGMARSFIADGGTVGVYSAPNIWADVIGTVPAISGLASLPTWKALGRVSESSATAACANAGFTPGGRVQLTQFITTWGGRDIDANVACKQFTTTARPVISGTAAYGKTLSARTGTWSPAVGTPAWQWKRGGVAIAGATKSTYAVTTADKGHSLTVTLTAKRTGYTSLAMTSTPTAVIGTAFTSTSAPTISQDVASSGADVLRAKATAWKPTAAFTYQWYRNGSAVAGATSSVYFLKPDDAGTTFLVKVTGKKSGYTTTVRTSASFAVPSAG